MGGLAGDRRTATESQEKPTGYNQGAANKDASECGSFKKNPIFGSNGLADGVLTGRHHHHHHANRNLKKMYVKAGGGREQ